LKSRYLKYVVRILLLTALALISFNYHIILYGLNQLFGQLSLIAQTRPVSQVLNDPDVSDSVKTKLLFIEEVKNFATQQLGLKASNSYQSYYDQKGKPVLWVLTAAPAFNMQPYKWEYPFLGKLSYKGFFNYQSGLQNLLQMQHQGYDADLSPVSAWSTLGWFKDPVLSSMLNKSYGSLAELIIHEMTHQTIYLKGDVALNENLATFVGEKGAELFLIYKYGRQSQFLSAYLNKIADNRIYANYMVASVKILDSLYQAPNFLQLSLKEKYLLKYRTIAQIINSTSQLHLKNPERFTWDFSSKKLPNNTYFLSYNDYHAMQDQMTIIYNDSCSASISALINYYQSHHSK
jgi:predicted aminopeptidase